VKIQEIAIVTRKNATVNDGSLVSKEKVTKDKTLARKNNLTFVLTVERKENYGVGLVLMAMQSSALLRRRFYAAAIWRISQRCNYLVRPFFRKAGRCWCLVQVDTVGAYAALQCCTVL
jgi:hypothetical protein